MPTYRNYTSGSIVYFQGDKEVGDVFVLQTGRVVLLSTSIDTGEEIKEEVQVGEFFGVKSALGRYPREETAQVIGKTQLIVFTLPEFEKFVLKNTRLIIKMLKVFSKQLRSIHRQIRDILKVGATRDPSYELMNVAESFHKTGNIDHAMYAYGKYLEHYPDGNFGARARELLSMSKRGAAYPPGYTTLDEALKGSGSGQNQMSSEFEEETPFGGDFDFQFDNKSATDHLNEGIGYYESGDFAKALESFQNALKNAGGDDQDAISRSTFEKGRCELKLGRLDDASQSFTTYVKNFAEGEFMKEAIYQIGVIAEAKGNRDRARALYIKIATMPPHDAITVEARKRLEKLK
jgi:TolA-binding protein